MELARPGHVEHSGDAVLGHVLERPDHVVLLDELDQRVEAGDARQQAPSQVVADRGDDVGPQHVAEPEDRDRQVGVVLGEVLHQRLDLDERALEAGPDRSRARGLLAEPGRVVLRRPVDVSRGLDHHLADRRARRARRGQEVEAADDVDLVEHPARDVDGVGLEEGVDDRVDLGGSHDPAEDGVLLVRADELGALEGDPGLVRPQAEDHLHVGLGLEGLGHPPAPEGVKPGDEDAPAHG
jgi:hypothetical protein